MYTTYQNFRDMLQETKEIDGKKTVVKTFELPANFSDYFNSTQDMRVIAAVYVNLYGYLKKVSAKYFRLDMQDKASFVTEEIWKALRDFDESRSVPFMSFLACYVDRRCYAENKMRENLVRKVNFDSEITCTLESVEEKSAVDTYACELTDYLKSVGLNESERMYCNIVIDESCRMTDSEIARLMGCSPANINYLKKRLRSKIQLV